MFSTLLIANRGEIACRIIRTAKQLGLRTIAIYSHADQTSLHVKLADEAYCIGENAPQASYLNIEAIINAATTAGADAIHPGYGFLSENPAFARACESHHITFIGPSVEAMQLMASKQRAKQCLEKTTVPLTPGYHGDQQTDQHLLQAAHNIGFPVLLKAASGGGGKGMRIVKTEADFAHALAGARREAHASFGDDTMLIEKQIISPRHVEIQLMADNHGHVVHLFERDCSIQRRHQKIIEEAPAPDLPSSLRHALADAAITVAQTIDYRGAGTVEFLVDKNHDFYFMEMNTRLQVEHPVTEMITGFDLVEWQLRIAAGEPLPKQQPDIHQRGHAIECRIYAEDATQGGLPSTGTLRVFEEPSGAHIRLDTGFKDNDIVTRHYDPMIAKLIAHGSTREEALQRLNEALRHYALGGIKTNLDYLQELITNPAFKAARLSTHFLEENHLDIPKLPPEHALMFAASMTFLAHQPKHNSLPSDTFSWTSTGHLTWPVYYQIDDERYTCNITPNTQNCFDYTYNETSHRLTVTQEGTRIVLDNGTKRLVAHILSDKNQITCYYQHTKTLIIQHSNPTPSKKTTHKKNSLTAPMPATVVAVLKSKGAQVEAGESLMVLEAMKMEHTIHAPEDGHLSEIFYPIGAQVDEGVLLMALDPLDTQPQNEEA
jgi:3-methylcrotonyl-CoA carboxylase alpha subunit